MEDLARQCRAAIVFPCYTRAPEKQFPFQFEQAYGVLDHIVRNPRAYGLDMHTFALAGDSAGGDFAATAHAVPPVTDNLQDTWPSL
jgi:acetyl esterase